MTNSYYARQVTLDDLKFAQQGTEVYNSAYNTEDGWTTEAKIVTGKLTETQDTEQFIKDSVLTDKLTQLFIFERDQQGNDAAVVGTLMIVPFPDLEEMPTEGEAMITRFAISPKHQSKGLGRLILDASLDVMREQGYQRCSIRVFENRPPVLSWYAKLGFADTGERRAFKAPPGKVLALPVGFVIMKKELL
ncbi:acyl-CoA N-acyltransferase [Thamnidium elegans]|nr:acyl-CoA N-acyltransferase [Thamnidium elegans]